MKKRYIFLMIGFLLIILSSLRIFWMNAFHNDSYIKIENGQLDLKNWNMDANKILLLDGGWEFYPGQLLIDGEHELKMDRQSTRMIDVPVEWNEFLEEGKSTPFGFGTYHLRINVDPEINTNYSLYIPSVRSASEVYVNGMF